MVQWTLTVTLDEGWVSYFTAYEYHLCFARFVQKDNGAKIANVVSHAEDVAHTITITWDDDYFGLAASKKGFSSGSKIDLATEARQIKPGRSATVQSYTDFETQSDDSRAPKDSFLFSTSISTASVLIQKINGKNRPIYITPGGSLLPAESTETLRPIPRIALWFQRDLETGTMMDAALRSSFILSTYEHDLAVHYDDKGRWHLISHGVDYTKGRSAKYFEGLGVAAIGIAGETKSLDSGFTDEAMVEGKAL